MARALVLLAPGAEEMETTIVVDVLRRAGVEVALAGVEGPETVTCSRGVRITPDLPLGAFDGLADAIVLPGGAAGAKVLAESAQVGARLRAHWDAGRTVAAICAGPTALARHGIAPGTRLTSHPGVREELAQSYRTSDDRVVEDGQLITSQGPGTSFEFALALVRKLCGEAVALKISGPMVL
jgi:protein DJ-1